MVDTDSELVDSWHMCTQKHTENREEENWDFSSSGAKGMKSTKM